jgi:hypothetical protein
MIYSPPHFNDPRHPSLYDGITGWASHAQQGLLIGIAVAAILEWTGLVILDWRQGPAAGFLLTLGAVAGWGLLEQRASTSHATLITAAQVLLIILGTITALVGGFAWLFWIMGPAPVL